MGTRDAVRSGRPQGLAAPVMSERRKSIWVGPISSSRPWKPPSAGSDQSRRSACLQKTIAGPWVYGPLALRHADCQNFFGSLLNADFPLPPRFCPGREHRPRPLDIADLVNEDSRASPRCTTASWCPAVGPRWRNHARCPPKPRSDAMDARVRSPLHDRRSSTFDWIMLALSFLTVGWIVVAY